MSLEPGLNDVKPGVISGDVSFSIALLGKLSLYDINWIHSKQCLYTWDLELRKLLLIFAFHHWFFVSSLLVNR